LWEIVGESGKACIFALETEKRLSMIQLLGDYTCRIDGKGRLKLPADLLKQLGEDRDKRFVLKQGADRCLVLYPEEVWEQKTTLVNQLNTLIKEEREYRRAFLRSARYVETDSSERINIPDNMLKYAEIEREVKVLALADEIEIWAVGLYEESAEEDERILREAPEKIWKKQP